MKLARFKRVAQKLRVPLGFVIVPAFVLLAHPNWTTLAVGGTIAFAGVLLRGWASGHLRKMAALTTSGPYAHTRNPLYLGSFVMAIGVAVAAGSWWLVVLATGAFLLVYVPVMFAEVDTMRELFPMDYEVWARQVPLFFPRITPATGLANASFDPALYMTYREYRAALGLATVIAFFAIRVLLEF
jgi:protein-S-isoprenylcysteine O-methyltransferase Ste14